MPNILGISLGTRFMGMAVMYDGELADFRVRTFYGPWNEGKQKDIIEVIRKTVVRYQVAIICVKTPRPTHCSQNILATMGDLRELCNTESITLTTCTIEALAAKYSSDKKGGKKSLVQAICRNYPEYKRLADLCSKKQVHRTLNFVKMFEAIACAEQALETGQ